MNLENGYNESKDDYGLKYKERGLLSSKTTTIKSHDESKTATGSLLSGDTVKEKDIEAKKIKELQDVR